MAAPKELGRNPNGMGERRLSCVYGSLGYWRVADSPILKMAINNDSLRKAGYVTLMGSYLERHPK